MSDYDCIRLNCPNWAGDGLCELSLCCRGTWFMEPACDDYNAGLKRPIKDALCPLKGYLFGKIARKLPPKLYYYFEKIVKKFLKCPESLVCYIELAEELDDYGEEEEEEYEEYEYYYDEDLI